MGWLARPIDAGTVSATGARLTLMPAAASCRAQRAASDFSPEAPAAVWSRAGGMVLKPAPCSCCTAPPSWSAARSRPRFAVLGPAREARWRVVASTRAAPVCHPPRRMTPPRWRACTRASRLVRPAFESSPTMSSCPARLVALMPATMRWAQDCVGVGVVAALVAGVVGVVTGDVGVAGTVDVPGELVPAGEEPAGEDDAVGPGVDEQAARSATAL